MKPTAAWFLPHTPNTAGWTFARNKQLHTCGLFGVTFTFPYSWAHDKGHESYSTSLPPWRMETAFWANFKISGLKITLFRDTELLWRKTTDWTTHTSLPWGCAGSHMLQFWDVKCGAHRLAENSNSPARMGQENRAWWWKNPSTCSSPEHPMAGTATLSLMPQVLNVTIRCPVLSLAIRPLSASHFINMEEWLFINAVLSLWVQKIFPVRTDLPFAALLSPSWQTVPRAVPTIFC